MGALFTIIKYSIGNMFLGILITVIGVSLMFFLIRSWFNHKTFTPLSFIVGGVLFVFLSFQSILFCGAVTIKSYTDDVEVAINRWVGNIPSYEHFDQEGSQEILNGITEEWPLVGYFIGGADFTGHTSLTIAESMADEIRSFMNYYMLRRLLWSLLFVVVGAVVVIKSMERTRSYKRTMPFHPSRPSRPSRFSSHGRGRRSGF